MDSTEMLLLFDKNAYCKDLMCQRGNTQVQFTVACEVIENLYKFEVVCQEAIYKFRILGANDVLFCATRPKATHMYKPTLSFSKTNKKHKAK